MIYKDRKRYYKNGGLIRRMKDASGGPIHYSRTMTTDNLSKAANYVGEYILKGLGAFGKIMTAPLTGGPLGPATVVLPKTKELLDAERKLRETQELLIGRASTWLSPLNYGAALATGNGLNARKGEEEVASWSPAWQAVGRLGELYVGPKAVKGASRVAINTAAKAGVKPAKAAVIAREINKGVNKNTPKYDNRIHSIRVDNLIYDYSSNPLLEFVNTIKTSPTNSYFMRAPSKIDITKLHNGRFRYEVVGDKVLPSGEVNGKFVSYGEPWKEFGFNEESALYEFPVGPKRGPNMMATDWKGRNKDYSVNEAYDYMKLEELLREDLRLLNEQMGKLFDKNYAAIRNNLIETKYPLLKEHIDTSIYGGNQTVIPSLKWNFDNFLNSPFYKYTIDPISNQVQKELVISGVPNKSVEPPTSLAFFERKPSKLTEAEKVGVPKLERNFTPKQHIAYYPGYQLKGLMKGSLLERQLSKNGTININLLNAYFNKASQLEREVANKVLAEKFAGLKTIDYNLFKKAVLDELISYNTKPQMQYSTYGMNRLGFNVIKESDGVGGILEYLPGVRTNTFTFESPKIPVGNNKHYDPTTLGHSRTYTTPEEPRVLHVMESLSDWAQNFKQQHGVESMHDAPPHPLFGDINSTTYVPPLHQYLANNYLQRQLQENLKYAAENGLTKMRYPTSETAAKIEGYLKVNHTLLNELSNLQMKLGELFENGEISWEEYDKMIDAINKLKKELFGKEYDPKHQTILKKYADFPKLFLKLFKDLKVRTVTDAKGNTWYEVDVPKGYLSREWQFKQGGKMNAIEQFKQGSKIHIKKKNRGKFTAYCGGNVTSACIAKAKASGNPTLVKRATFAANARKWKHKEGGIIKAATGLSTSSFIDPMIVDYIKAIENPNRIGWNGKIWKAPGLKGYDLNLRGYGIDINTNNAARKLTAGRQGQWLTDDEANTLMRDHILYITNAANKHIKGFGELPIKRKAALLGMLYRGDSVNKSNINITEPDDDKFFNSVHNYYISKGLKERANNSSKFFKSYKTTPNFNFNNYKDLNYPFKYIK